MICLRGSCRSLELYLKLVNLNFKSFETLHEATEWSNKQPIESIIEIKQYEGSNNNGSTFWSEK